MLPPGTYVYVPPYVVHRDARNFVSPDAFLPERWLVAAGHLALSRTLLFLLQVTKRALHSFPH